MLLRGTFSTLVNFPFVRWFLSQFFPPFPGRPSFSERGAFWQGFVMTFPSCQRSGRVFCPEPSFSSFVWFWCQAKAEPGSIQFLFFPGGVLSLRRALFLFLPGLVRWLTTMDRGVADQSAPPSGIKSVSVSIPVSLSFHTS